MRQSRLSCCLSLLGTLICGFVLGRLWGEDLVELARTWEPAWVTAAFTVVLVAVTAWYAITVRRQLDDARNQWEQQNRPVLALARPTASHFLIVENVGNAPAISTSFECFRLDSANPDKITTYQPVRCRGFFRPAEFSRLFVEPVFQDGRIVQGAVNLHGLRIRVKFLCATGQHYDYTWDVEKCVQDDEYVNIGRSKPQQSSVHAFDVSFQREEGS